MIPSPADGVTDPADQDLTVVENGETGDEGRSSTLARGEPQFSQTREAVENNTPITQALAAETEKVHRRFSRAAQHLDRANATGDQALIDSAELKYTAAATAFSELSTEPPESASEFCETETGLMTLSQALKFDRDRSLEAEEQRHRLQALEVLLAYVFSEGMVNPWQAFKRLVAIARRVKPQYLRAMSQTEIGLVLKETKAAPSAREKKVVEGLMRRFKMLGFHLLGGTKSETTRRRCAVAQEGNTNRRGGRRRK